jgi:hypothetical protein
MSHSQQPEQRSQKALELVCGASGSESGYLYFVTPKAVIHAATFHGGEPPAELEQAVSRYLVRERERSEMLTTMATGPATDDALDDCTVQLAGTAYELVLLRSVTDDVEQVTAVAAVVSRGAAERDPYRPQLLAAVAAQLKNASPAPQRARRVQRA